MTRLIDREHLELVVPTVPEPRQRAWGCAGWVVAVVAMLAAPASLGGSDPVSAAPGKAVDVVGQALPGASDQTASLVQAGAPTPTGQLTGPLYTASMTWCAPRGNQCTEWGGDARLAAVHSFTFGDTPYWVRLWRGGDHADALVVSHCACHDSEGYVDVSPFVFRQLAALHLGRVDVIVEVLDWPYETGGDPPPHPADQRMRAEDNPQPTLPATDAR